MAANNYNDSLVGAEVYATSTEGRFTGTASGDLLGQWYIDVLHTPLAGTANITGGAFKLATTLNREPAVVDGNFASGMVKQTGGFSGCSNQTYALSGNLVNVGPEGGRQVGTGSFNGVLTHYRYSLYGYCITYSASVTGSVSLSF